MSEEQAIIDSNLKQTTKLCPLLRKNCSINCVAFREAYFYNYNYAPKPERKIVNAFCASPMLDYELIPEGA